jgi:hypothetical protein
MTDKLIIYPQENNTISILIPTGELPIDDVCLKDVPDGIPYILINKSDLPNDWIYRNAWDADFSNPDGYGIGSEKWMELKNNQKEENIL